MTSVTILGPIFHFPPFLPTCFALSVTYSPLVPSRAARTTTQSPDKSPDKSLDHSAVNYYMPLLRSPQHHYLTHYGLPAHDVLSIDHQLMMELLGLSTHNCIYRFTGHHNTVWDPYRIGLEVTLLQYGLQAGYPLYQTIKIWPYDW